MVVNLVDSDRTGGIDVTYSSSVVLVLCSNNDTETNSLLDQTTLNENDLRSDSDISIDMANNRLFKIGHVYILSQLKKLVQLFCIKWSFATIRLGYFFVIVPTKIVLCILKTKNKHNIYLM